MACGAQDIPNLEFPRDEIIEVSHTPSFVPFLIADSQCQIIPSSYNNEAKRVHIDGLPPKMIPGSPEDLQMPAPPSGLVTPFSGLGTPARNTPSGTGTTTPTLHVEGGLLPMRRPNLHPGN